MLLPMQQRALPPSHPTIPLAVHIDKHAYERLLRQVEKDLIRRRLLAPWPHLDATVVHALKERIRHAQVQLVQIAVLVMEPDSLPLQRTLADYEGLDLLDEGMVGQQHEVDPQDDVLGEGDRMTRNHACLLAGSDVLIEDFEFGVVLTLEIAAELPNIAFGDLVLLVHDPAVGDCGKHRYALVLSAWKMVGKADQLTASGFARTLSLKPGDLLWAF